MLGIKRDLHRGPARGVRARLRLPDVPRQRALRGPVPAGHLDRPAADRQAADRDRAPRPAPTPSPTAPPARATTRCASSSTYYALNPDIKVIAPWREWDLTSRTKLIDFAEKHQIPIAKDKRGEAPFSVDANLLHISYEGKALEDPWHEPEEFVYQRTISPEAAPDKPTYVEIEFERGDAVAIDGKKLSPAALLTRLNELGKANGIGRLDLVENRFVGMKSRGVYETPGGTILHAAHRGIESITLDRGAAHLKDELMPRYAELIYNGFWFSPEREMLQALIDKSQESVDGHGAAEALQGHTVRWSAANRRSRSTATPT